MKDPVSTPWVIASLAILVVTEVLLGQLLGQLVGGLVSRPLQYRLEVGVMLASWWIGGLIVGLVSPKVRLLEPGIAAGLAVALTSLYSLFMPVRWFVFSPTRVLLGGIIAFGLALWGADLGERLAARLGNRASRAYTGDGPDLPR